MQEVLNNNEELFDGPNVDLINPKKLNLAIDKFKEIATKNFEITSKYIQQEIGRRKYFVDSFIRDVKMFNEIESYIEVISKSKQNIQNGLIVKSSQFELKKNNISEKITKITIEILQ